MMAGKEHINNDWIQMCLSAGNELSHVALEMNAFMQETISLKMCVHFIPCI